MAIGDWIQSPASLSPRGSVGGLGSFNLLITWLLPLATISPSLGAIQGPSTTSQLINIQKDTSFQRFLEFLELCARKQKGEGKDQMQEYLFSCSLLCHTSQILWFLKNWRFVVTLYQANLSVPFFQQHLLSSFLNVTFW